MHVYVWCNVWLLHLGIHLCHEKNQAILVHTAQQFTHKTLQPKVTKLMAWIWQHRCCFLSFIHADDGALNLGQRAEKEKETESPIAIATLHFLCQEVDPLLLQAAKVCQTGSSTITTISLLMLLSSLQPYFTEILYHQCSGGVHKFVEVDTTTA